VSAIAGLFYRDGRSLDSDVLLAMTSRLVHRGPHGSAFWNLGPVGFGTRILHTTSPPRGNERPLARQADSMVVAADARIDNRVELLHALDLGPSIETITDAELILEAYRAWGRDAPRRLIGDFAFAIWDEAKGSLFCARDTIGARQFCYHLSSHLFAFASEVKGVLAVPEVPVALDEVKVGFYLNGFLDDPERTFYRDVQRLPAAHFLEVSRDGVRMERYWKLDPERVVRYSSDEEYIESFREVFFEAVRCRLRDADPLGAALSGGLDSSSVVVAARRLLPKTQPVHAFSAVFPGLPENERRFNDESEYIDAVAALEGIVSHRVHADRISPLTDYDRVLWHHDSPPSGFNLYMRWGLFTAAQQEGVRVFLDGTDGDSVVSKGFERFSDLASDGDWPVIVREIEALTERQGSPKSWFYGQLAYPELIRLARTGKWGNWLRGCKEIAKASNRSRAKIFLRYGVGAFVPNQIANAFRGHTPLNSTKPWIREEFAQRIELSEREAALSQKSRNYRSAREDHARVLSLPRYQYAMELINGSASAFGIEHRFPFFDRRLMEYCVAIPPEQKLAGGWTRLILRRAMEGILPSQVQWRAGKGNLGFNFVRGMHQVEAPKLKAALFDGVSMIEDFVDLDLLRTAYRRFLSGQPSLQANADAMFLYKAAVLTRWLRDYGPHG
jgi:asparagine synthase (glutamine-hydrolysing)